jgi:hypothetical protein
MLRSLAENSATIASPHGIIHTTMAVQTLSRKHSRHNKTCALPSHRRPPHPPQNVPKSRRLPANSLAAIESAQLAVGVADDAEADAVEADRTMHRVVSIKKIILRQAAAASLNLKCETSTDPSRREIRARHVAMLNTAWI